MMDKVARAMVQEVRAEQLAEYRKSYKFAVRYLLDQMNQLGRDIQHSQKKLEDKKRELADLKWDPPVQETQAVIDGD